MSKVKEPGMIGGIQVHFPYKPYPSQLAMSHKIICSLKWGQNSILESPTGSGKTMALLCAALAWQKSEYEMRDDESKRNSELLSLRHTSPEFQLNASLNKTQASSDLRPLPSSEISLMSIAKKNLMEVVNVSTEDEKNSDDSDDEFQKPKWFKAFHPKSVSQATVPKGITTSSVDSMNYPTDDFTIPIDNLHKPVIRKIPKIFYGTRTHNQIKQIIRELRKTDYKDTKMCILGSREVACVHPVVSRDHNKTEACKNLLLPDNKGGTCIYFRRADIISTHKGLAACGLSSAWDIEDLVAVGRKNLACPFYATHALKTDADIIFCPYNYMIDPQIKESLDINLNNQVIILDEAHNSENAARDAASYEVKEFDLHMMMTSLESMAQVLEPEVAQSYEILAKMLSYEDVRSENETKNSGDQISSVSLMSLSGFFMVLNFMYQNNLKYAEDYQIAILKKLSFEQQSKARDGKTNWLTASKRFSRKCEVSLNFWCLSPAVAFNALKQDARSIILTSGTLSPMSSFQSELAVPFTNMLETGHVVNPAQIWVASISEGPNRSCLNASFVNTEKYEYQDEVGETVLSICKIVPHGVLCFVSSYNLLNKLMSRWKVNGIWQRIGQHKHIVVEPRNKDDFDVEMENFYSAVNESAAGPQPLCSGAIFFAVFRGKASEGLDFADNYARAVISIGIPFPSVNDLKVKLKREYNDRFHNQRGTLPGSVWYEGQAYRALNQALGRCIRHRNDWGAIIMLDDRFSKNSRITDGLSKWVRNALQHYHQFSSAMSALERFVKLQKANPSINCIHPKSQNVSGAALSVCKGEAKSGPSRIKPLQASDYFMDQTS